jgi:hypothetical protein
LQLYDTVGGHPGSVLEAITVTNQMPNFGDFGSGHLVSFSSTVHPLLQAGGTYWLLPLVSATATDVVWNDNNQAASGPYAVSGEAVPTTWATSPNLLQGAFEVTGTPSPAPEPSTLALAGAGALGLLGYGWRKRKRAAAA